MYRQALKIVISPIIFNGREEKFLVLSLCTHFKGVPQDTIKPMALHATALN
ncbi:hypothetical protein ABIE54_001294 [Chitinophagaceae bacterium OAS944]